ncbi:MAG: rRNA maturation RNase YbeY [Maricaulaceae bacterium]
MTACPINIAPIDIAIDIQDAAWAELPFDLDAIAKRAAAVGLAQLNSPILGELSLAFVNDADIQILNRDYREKDKPTNVLSFPSAMPENIVGAPSLMGDIVLARETIEREAAEKSTSTEHHLTHLIIHGLLHLQGYDHETDAEAEEMEALEIAALKTLGIDNPYEFGTKA